MLNKTSLMVSGRTELLKAFATIAALVCLNLAGAGAQSTPISQPANVSEAPMAVPTETSMDGVKVGPGDLLEIKVFRAPDLDTKARIGSDGNVDLPLTGQIHVAGLTSGEIQTEIAKRLVAGGFMRDAYVSVLITDFQSQGVTVIGEVQHPGVYPMMGTKNLFDLISSAGGFTDKAAPYVMITHRVGDPTPVKVALSQDGNLASTDTQSLRISGGDTIFVPRAGIVYVIGDVAKPNGIKIENGATVSVLQALALSGGTNKTASLKTAKLIRDVDGSRQEFPVNLEKIVTLEEPDMPLKDRDILYIPYARGRVIAAKTLEAIVQAAVGVTVYTAARGF